MPELTLLLMKGPPGTGKSTLARELARCLRWPIVDKDVVRDILPQEIGGRSYEAMLELAGRQLEIGLSVIADSPLGYGTAYRKAMSLATLAGATLRVVECVCSDRAEWRRRIESRAGTGLPSHHATSWPDVEAFARRSRKDPFDLTVPSMTVDTATPLQASVAGVLAWLRSH